MQGPEPRPAVSTAAATLWRPQASAAGTEMEMAGGCSGNTHLCWTHTRGLWLFTNDLDKQSSLSHININTNTHMDLRLQLQTSEPAPPAAAGTGHNSEREKSKTFRTVEGYAESCKADKLKWKDDQTVQTILCYVITAETLGCCVKCKHILNTANVQIGTFDYFMKKTTENIWI